MRQSHCQGCLRVLILFCCRQRAAYGHYAASARIRMYIFWSPQLDSQRLFAKDLCVRAAFRSHHLLCDAFCPVDVVKIKIQDRDLGPIMLSIVT
jgi:hypothetical protein